MEFKKSEKITNKNKIKVFIFIEQIICLKDTIQLNQSAQCSVSSIRKSRNNDRSKVSLIKQLRIKKLMTKK